MATKRNGSETLNTIIGAESNLEGRLSVKGSVRIDGHFDGKLVSDGTVTLGPRGEIKGDVRADTAIIGGHVTGSVVARNRMVLEGSARIDGDIATSHLEVADGATLNGNCSMTTESIDKLEKLQAGQQGLLIPVESNKPGAVLPPMDEEDDALQA